MATSEQAIRWVVLKFGGTSVATEANWQIIAELVRARLAEGLRPVVVHSALAGVSNQLSTLLEVATEGDHEVLLQELVARHYALAADMKLDGEALLGGYLSELQQLIAGVRLVREVSPRVHAKVMALPNARCRVTVLG